MNENKDFPRIQKLNKSGRLYVKELKNYDKAKITKDTEHEYRLFIEPMNGEPDGENEKRIDERGRMYLNGPIDEGDTVALIKNNSKKLEVTKVVEISDGDKKWEI